MTEPRLLPNIRNSEYHLRPTISQSDLKSFNKSITDYYAEITGQLDKEESDELNLGNAFHTLLLEGEESYLDYIKFVPTKNGKTMVKNGADNLAVWAEFEAMIRETRRTKDCVPFTPKQDAQVRNMYQAYLRNPKAVELMSLPGETEITGEWPYLTKGGEETGLLLRGRVDRLIWDYDGAPLIIDWKSTADKSSSEPKPEQFRKAVRYNGYDIQGAHYREMIQACTGQTPRVMLIAINKDKSFETVVYQLEPSMLDLGLAKRNAILEEYLDRVESNYWGTRWDGVQKLEALDWELKAVGIDPNGGGF